VSKSPRSGNSLGEAFASVFNELKASAKPAETQDEKLVNLTTASIAESKTRANSRTFHEDQKTNKNNHSGYSLGDACSNEFSKLKQAINAVQLDGKLPVDPPSESNGNSDAVHRRTETYVLTRHKQQVVIQHRRASNSHRNDGIHSGQDLVKPASEALKKGGTIKPTHGDDFRLQSKVENPKEKSPQHNEGVNPGGGQPAKFKDITKPIQTAPMPKPPVTPLPKQLKAIEKLRADSAEVYALRVRCAASRTLRHRAPVPVSDLNGTAGKLAILGLDFGTAFTKAVVRWESRHFAVDWSTVVEAESPYLLPSVFSESSEGEIVLGEKEALGWKRHDGIKIRLLDGASASNIEYVQDAVIFVSLAFRYAAKWLAETQSSAESSEIRWRLHLGLPASSWDDVATTNLFRTIACAARVLACSKSPVTRRGAVAAIEVAAGVERPAVDVLPEFACQIHSYLGSAERKHDLHALVDFGAGTLDMAFFNVHEDSGVDVLPIFAARVENLGAHYLLAALAGRIAESLEWKDVDVSLDDDGVATRTGEPIDAIKSRRAYYLNSIGDSFNETYREARSRYPTSPVFRLKEPMRLFLCGGGGRIPSIRGRIDKIASEAERVFGIKIQVLELKRPKNIVGSFSGNFDRISVAFGLSHLAANIGDVMRRGNLEPFLGPAKPPQNDRDDDR